MITKEDIERLGKAQAITGQRYTETLMSSEYDMETSRKAYAEHEVAAKAWLDASREFIKQKKETQV